jgi:hypothetical protein
MTEMEIVHIVNHEDVYFTYTQTHSNGKELECGPRETTVFNPEEALALLLINDVVFLNNNWWKEEWTKEERDEISINVICNDVFAWGCADCERLPFKELKTLYEMWKKDPGWGSSVWCMIQRKEMPQKPLEKIIRKEGIWDLDSLGLEKNFTDEEVTAMFTKKVVRNLDNETY